MSIASAIVTKQQQIADAYTAVDNKGGTLPATQNLTNLATAISSISSGGSGGGGTGTRDVPLTRISDDNGNEIGTWYMNFVDASRNEYKVVLLDAQYRAFATQWCSNSGAVTNMPLYSNLKSSNVWEAKDTATANTQLILDYCTANSYTSTACSHCRAQSFTIGGTTYYGQLPNTVEMTFLARHYNEFDSLDTSASSETSKNFSTVHTFWASSQYDNANGWGLYPDGNIDYGNKSINYYACPVLEIPVV